MAWTTASVHSIDCLIEGKFFQWKAVLATFTIRFTCLTGLSNFFRFSDAKNPTFFFFPLFFLLLPPFSTFAAFLLLLLFFQPCQPFCYHWFFAFASLFASLFAITGFFAFASLFASLFAITGFFAFASLFCQPFCHHWIFCFFPAFFTIRIFLLLPAFLPSLDFLLLPAFLPSLDFLLLPAFLPSLDFFAFTSLFHFQLFDWSQICSWHYCHPFLLLTIFVVAVFAFSLQTQERKYSVKTNHHHCDRFQFHLGYCFLSDG